MGKRDGRDEEVWPQEGNVLSPYLGQCRKREARDLRGDTSREILKVLP